MSILTLANELGCAVSPDGGGIGNKTSILLETVLYKINVQKLDTLNTI